MFCGKCGQQNPDSGSFCIKCGHSLQGLPTAPQTQVVPASSVIPESLLSSELSPLSQAEGTSTKPHKKSRAGLFVGLVAGGLILIAVLLALFLVVIPMLNENDAYYVAGVQDADSSLFGYIDKKGDYVIEPQYEFAGAFGANGLAGVQDADSSLWGYIDKKGDYVIEPQYEGAGDFGANGLAVVKDADSRLWGYIDKKGDYVIEPQFEVVSGDFSENGLALVMDADSELYGYIDKTGDYVIKPQFEVVPGDFSENGLALVADADSELYGYIDKTGDYVIEPQFIAAGDFAKVN